MTIEEIKNEIVTHIDEFITPEMKAEGVKFLRNEVLPYVKEVLQTALDKVEEQAATEKGWCLFRDKYFYPGLSRVVLYVLGKMLDKMEAAATAEMEGSDAPAEQPGQE